MTRHRSLTRLAAALLLACVIPRAAAAQAGRPIGDAAYDSAFFAWEQGDYVSALEGLERLLGGAAASRYHEPAAALTGELFVTTEVTTDGRNVRWAPDSRHFAYEVGGVTKIAVHDGTAVRALGELPGRGAAFDPAGGRVAYLEGTEPQRVRVRELASGREAELRTGGLTVQSLTFRPADGRLYGIAPEPGAVNTTQLYRLDESAEPVRVTAGEGPRSGLQWLADDRALFLVGRGTFTVWDLSAGAGRTYDGSAPTVAADGRTIAYLTSSAEGSEIRVLDGDGTARVVVRRAGAIQNPSISPDGTGVTYQAMPREDWELYVARIADGVETRLTREIQHDLLPRFAGDDRVLAVMGEARHRRSFLYDAATGARTRLFHNNTVRTVAPEYEWLLSPDHGKLLIVAERDGDTVSPERGVYLLDLTRRVTPAELRARVQRMLAQETALRTRGRALFAGLEAQAQAAVDDVSTDRIYWYQADLYAFDSKYITQPGNALAIEYIAGKLREFGYQPELQWFETPAGAGRPPIRTANIIAPLRGTVHADVLYVVSSHFDSVERGPGADDNTSGTTALLEAARVLATRPQPATLHFAFFTGEEAGLRGSREYVRRALERGDRLVGALNNDMIGFANNQRLDNTIRYSNDGIRDIQHAAAFLFTDLITYDAKYYRSTDAHAYYEAYGDIVGGIGSYPILGNPHYHQSHDQLETMNHRLIAEVSKTTVATLIQLANVPSRVSNLEVTGTGARREARWDALPERDIREYIVAVGPPGEPARTSTRVREPRAALADVRAGDEVRVSAVNARGAESWDTARALIPQ